MRRLATILACAFFVLMLAVPALAAGQLQFTVTPSVPQAVPGDKVEFEVSVNGDAYSAVGYIPNYDKNVWELLEGECVTEESMLDDFSPADGGVLAHKKAAVRNGTVFRFTMEVRSDAPAGQTVLSGDVSARDDSGVMNTALADAVVTIQSQNVPEPTQTEATKPVEQTPPTQSVEETVDTGQTQPVPPDSTSTQTTDPTQAIVTGGNQPTEETAGDSTLTTGQGTIPELEDMDACVAEESDAAQEADPIPKGYDTLLVWIAVIAVVAATTAASWFFLRKKETE